MRIASTAFGAMALLVTTGCIGRPALAPEARVVVFPFAVDATLDADGRVVRAEAIDLPADVGATTARRLAEYLALQGVDVVVADDDGTPADLDAAIRAAFGRGADGVILGAVSEFGEREGTAWAVRRPAAVGYDVVLARVDDGRVLLAERASERQRAVSEDLTELPTLLRTGGRWGTRAELMDIALRRTAVQFRDAMQGGAGGVDAVEAWLPRLGAGTPGPSGPNVPSPRRQGE